MYISIYTYISIRKRLSFKLPSCLFVPPFPFALYHAFLPRNVGHCRVFLREKGKKRFRTNSSITNTYIHTTLTNRKKRKRRGYTYRHSYVAIVPSGRETDPTQLTRNVLTQFQKKENSNTFVIITVTYPRLYSHTK